MICSARKGGKNRALEHRLYGAGVCFFNIHFQSLQPFRAENGSHTKTVCVYINRSSRSASLDGEGTKTMFQCSQWKIKYI